MEKKTRFYELDIARAISMLGMPIVHVYEELMIQGIAASGVWNQGLLLTYSCILGPSVFMISLGMNLVFSRNTTSKQLIERGIKTILMFYALNLVRFIIPSFIAYVCGDTGALSSALKGSLCADILFFAGGAFVFFGLIKKFKVSSFYALLIAVLMLTLDMLIPEPTFKSEYVGIALGKFFYVNGWSCFPILPWMIFPAIGYCVGQYIVKMQDEEERGRFWKKVFFCCTIGIVAVSVCIKSYGLSPLLIAASPANSYITDLVNVVLNILAAGIWYSACYFVYSKIKNTKIPESISCFSQKILVFYCVQWILVGWLEYMLLAAGYRNQGKIGMTGICIIGIVFLFVSVKITTIIQNGRGSRKGN